ncbi:MAG: glycosyltransferase [Nitrospirota bacterium]|nr:glycosyltransferase [Nitrospirota bacterium]
MVLELSKSLQKTHNCYPIVGIIKNEYNPHVETVDEARANNIETAIFPCKSQFDLSVIASIRAFIREKNIDVVHCHGYKSNFYGLLASKSNIGTITTNHNWLKSHWKLKIYCFLDSLWIRYFGRIVAVSEGVKADMLKYLVPEEKIRVIDNGIDLERFNREISAENLREEFGLNENSKVIGTIGNLGHEKAHGNLLKAAREVIEIHKSVRFLIVGDGSLREYLMEEAVSLGIEDKIIFAGYRKDIPELLSLMDIFVLPSIKEGLPMVLLEAMAAKKPVIATRVGAVPKVLKDDAGILIEPGDIAGLRDAIIELMGNREEAEKLAVRGYIKLRNEYSSQNMSKRYLGLYNELISGSSSENIS